MNETVLEARGLGFAVRGKELVAGVDLALRAGSYTAILGPNGAGKSTLLRLFCGVLAATQGAVRLEGEPIERLSRVRIARRLSYLPQDTATRFDVTVWDAVAMGRHPHRRSWQTMSARDVAVVHEALARVDIADLAARTLPTLSGGERQRVFLARALAQEAAILVLDEPTHALDVRHQLELMDLLAGLHREGKTIVVAMHDLDLVWGAVPDCVLLAAGRVAAAGAVRETLPSPTAAAVFGVRITTGAGGLRCRRAADQ
ncbi:MAG: ABC transporter ATP-binding protein [Planctomycetota bacterium]